MRYAIIETQTGFFWGDYDTATAEAACHKADQETGDPETYTYIETTQEELLSGTVGYLVLDATRLELPAFTDGQDPETIDLVMACPLAGAFKRVKVEEHKDQYLITFGGYNIHLPSHEAAGSLERVITQAHGLAAEYQKGQPAGTQVSWSIKQLNQYDYGACWDVVVRSTDPEITGRQGGKKGGAARTAKKAAAAAENGQKGGRPRGFRRIAFKALRPRLFDHYQETSQFSHKIIEAKQSPDYQVLLVDATVYVMVTAGHNAVISLKLVSGDSSKAQGTWFDGSQVLFNLKTGKLTELAAEEVL